MMDTAQRLSTIKSRISRAFQTGRYLLGFVLLFIFVACSGEPDTAGTGYPEQGKIEVQEEAAAETAVRQPTISKTDLRYATSEDIRFDHLSLEQGLSQSVVLDILQDSQGFIWLGTQDGLNRYDGYEFTVFRHSSEDPHSLSGDFITALDEDDDGIIWIGTNGGGLNSYDRRSGKFTRYVNDTADPTSLSNDQIDDILVDRHNTVWIGTTNGGLNRLDRKSGGFIHYRPDPKIPHSISSDNISSITQDQDGSLWIGTYGGGLNHFDPQSERFSVYRNDPDDEASILADNVTIAHVDQDGTLWLAVDGFGLDRFDPQTEQFNHFQNDADDPNSLTANSIIAINHDSKGNLWLGTNGGGLTIFDPENELAKHFQADARDPFSLSNNQVLSIYEDQAGVLWFGTFGGGVNKFDPARQKFSLYRSDPDQTNGLNSDHIWAFLEDSDGLLWVGTYEGGLNRYDPASGEWAFYKSDPQDSTSLASDSILSIYEDGQGQLWLGSTDNGVGRLNPETGEFTNYETPPWVLAISEDSSGQLWIGSFGGLGKYEAETDQFRYLQNDPNDLGSISDNGVVAIVENQEGALWIGTFNGGLNKFDPQSEQFVRYQHDLEDPNSLGNDMILTMLLATDGTLWLGTAGGLDKFEPDIEAFTHYGEEDGLLNETIYAILEDDQGKIWFSTNMGISQFDPQAETFRHFDTRDGLQSIEFNQGSAYKSPSGEMFFGGVSGFNVFHPDLVQESEFIPPVVITDFQLFNESVLPGEESPLSTPIEVTEKIALSYTDDFLTFEFAALDYSTPEEIEYAYLLEGFDKDWNSVGNRRFAGYTNVPPGAYTFRVRGTNSDGVWSESEAAVDIVIPPPFWQTWWFRILAVLAIAGIAVAVFAARLRVVEGQRRQLEVQVDERTKELTDTLVQLERSKDAAEAANRAKSAFLANMSHEFRTPLNAILGFTQLLLRDASLDEGQSENIEIVHRSSEHLLGLINDVLEISKIEAGRTTLNPTTFDLHRMLYGLEEMFRLRAEHKGVTLRLELTPYVPQYVFMDEGKLRQVLMNLLGNAVKFTELGHVLLRVTTAVPGQTNQTNIERLFFVVEDSGPGIPLEEQESLFEPFVQATAGHLSQEGTGLGLTISRQHVRLMGGDITLQSDVGQGSIFRFDVPCEVVTESAVRKPVPERHIVGLEPGQEIYRLLIVDDEAANRQILVKLLAPLGFEVKEAANGQEAIDVWQVWEPHLIWMDMRMPVMDGHEATKHIKETTKGQETIIVALTASGLEEERDLILSEGCDDYLRKPFYEEDLYGALAKHLGTRFVYDDTAIAAEADEDDGADTAVDSATQPRGEAELVARMTAVPPDLTAALEQATTLGDLSRIDSSVATIEAFDPLLAAELATMAHEFEHERILSLINKANGKAYGEYQQIR
jgi:signal transduction histidine kinase/ligand-binding sensor domain-containing protein/CheY-like chemotaxis protein